MANSGNNGASLPVILIVDMDNEVEEFVIFNPPAGPGSTINTTKLKEGLNWIGLYSIIIIKNSSEIRRDFTTNQPSYKLLFPTFH